MCKALEEIAEMAKKEGVRIGIKAFVEICEDLGISFEQTVEMVLEKFELTPEEARGHAEQYRKSNTPQQADGAPNLLRSKPRE